ncbi:MAG: 1-acyl-sn-glycerol-3-phosphate acyltransferase [Verrucomicrobiae bacterium]|nr:1-acyl-sn-glycerol-3-phosphate acyltransferase [Verrucomicrobiae bacterium]
MTEIEAPAATFWYRFGRFLCALYYRCYHKLEVYDAENVPLRGPVLLAANHASFLDPPLVGVAAPRPAHFMARKTLFRSWLGGWLLPRIHCIPLDRDGGGAAGIKAALRLLEGGAALVIFPEGTRSEDGELQPAKAGAGWLVLKAQVPVVPVRIWGTFQAMPKGGKARRSYLEVKFGRPMRFDPGEYRSSDRGAALRASQRIMDAIAELEPHPGAGRSGRSSAPTDRS